MPKLVLLTLLYLTVAVIGTGSVARDASPPFAADVLVIPVSGPIGPALSDFVARGLVQAHEEGRRAVIIRLDTPGGLDSSMRVIIKAIIASPVPVITTLRRAVRERRAPAPIFFTRATSRRWRPRRT